MIQVNWGWQKRFDLIQKLIDVNHYQSYLEVGVSSGLCWKEIMASQKTGVDPFSPIPEVIKQHSDEFFEHNTDKYDIIFIDGDHQYEQVIRDINNAWHCLNENGVIVLHDMMPVNHIQASNPRIRGDASWCGDVYKANFDLLGNSYAICEIDHGCGIITNLKQDIKAKHHHIDFRYFEQHISQIPKFRFENSTFTAKDLFHAI